MKQPILLTLREMARVTAGRWRNLPDAGLEVTGVNFFLPRVTPGDLFVYRKGEDYDADSALRRAFKRGAVAAMVRRGTVTDERHPLLEVTDPTKALQDLALAASLKFDGTRILVTGSHGKTGFKTQLHHLIRKQILTHAHLDSANKEVPVWRTLAAIPQGARVAIVEVAVPTAHVGEDRALLVRPDYCVITGIGPEHLSSHKTLENLIRNKAEVVTGLRPGGRCLLNADDAHYGALRTAVEGLSRCEILTFGSLPCCQGKLLGASFGDLRWRVRAEILGEEIEYELHLAEDYAPLASVGVLLTAKLLGGDLAAAVAEYPDYRHYDSSGKLHRVNTASGPFFVYDQTQRGELKGFESMFELMSRLRPGAGGRKIAVVSEFINLEDNPGQTPDLDGMRALMARAGIDLLYTVKEFKRHGAAVPPGVEWRLHGETPDDIRADLLGTVRENDLVFLRGVLSANLTRLVADLLGKGQGDLPHEAIY